MPSTTRPKAPVSKKAVSPTRKRLAAKAPERQVDAPSERTIVIMFHGREHSSSTISREVVHYLMNEMGGVCSERVKDSTVDIWLDSPGGDAHAAYKFALFLMAKFETINFVVMDYAKSAATLLTFTADKLFMSSCAELGPLDMQHVREGDMQMQSALSTADAMEFLFGHAFENAFLSGAQILQGTRLSREKSITHMLNFSAALFRPLIEQLDPVAIHAAASGLEVTVEYGSRILGAKQPDRSRQELKAIANLFVREYPTHGFIIDRKEARDVLRLPVHDIESYDLKDQVEQCYNSWIEHGKDFVHVTTASEILSAAKEEGKSVP